MAARQARSPADAGPGKGGGVLRCRRCGRSTRAASCSLEAEAGAGSPVSLTNGGKNRGASLWRLGWAWRRARVRSGGFWRRRSIPGDGGVWHHEASRRGASWGGDHGSSLKKKKRWEELSNRERKEEGRDGGTGHLHYAQAVLPLQALETSRRTRRAAVSMCTWAGAGAEAVARTTPNPTGSAAGDERKRLVLASFKRGHGAMLR